MNVIMSVPPSGFDEETINKVLKGIPWDIKSITLIQSASRGTGRQVQKYALDKSIDFKVIEVDWNYSSSLSTKYDAAFILWNGMNRRSEYLLNTFRNSNKSYFIYNTDEENDDEDDI